jgi:hypothetical protein
LTLPVTALIRVNKLIQIKKNLIHTFINSLINSFIH